MDLVFRIIIAALGFFCFVLFFSLAAGTLSPKKLNITNICFYFLLMFFVIGGSIVFLGFRNHYLIQKVRNPAVFQKAYFILLYGVIALPLFQILINLLMGIRNYKVFYSEYVARPVYIDRRNSNTAFLIVLVLSVIGFLATAYTIWKVGYIALVELARGNTALMNERSAITRHFAGNQYIRNILALGMVPPLSYLSYIYWRQTKSRKWGLLFAFLLLLSVLCKTYNFEKAPIIFYFGFFYVLECMMGKVKKLGKAVFVILAGAAAMVFIYFFILGYSGRLLSLTNGPLSRLLITQVGTLFLHVDLFPEKHAFLAGSSFPKALSWLWGAAESGIRSGRVVMENYNRAAVQAGTAGVMNSIYIAEAYANFGWRGVLLAPLVVGFCCSFFPNLILMQRKDPLNMTLYLVFTISYTNSIIGGFTDYLYNVLLAFLVVLLLVIKVLVQGGTLHFRKKDGQL